MECWLETCSVLFSFSDGDFFVGNLRFFSGVVEAERSKQVTYEILESGLLEIIITSLDH